MPTTIIHYTNPTRKNGRAGYVYECAVCEAKFDTEEEARACAERDHQRKET